MSTPRQRHTPMLFKSVSTYKIGDLGCRGAEFDGQIRVQGSQRELAR